MCLLLLMFTSEMLFISLSHPCHRPGSYRRCNGQRLLMMTIMIVWLLSSPSYDCLYISLEILLLRFAFYTSFSRKNFSEDDGKENQWNGTDSYFWFLSRFLGSQLSFSYRWRLEDCYLGSGRHYFIVNGQYRSFQSLSFLPLLVYLLRYRLSLSWFSLLFLPQNSLSLPLVYFTQSSSFFRKHFGSNHVSLQKSFLPSSEREISIR